MAIFAYHTYYCHYEYFKSPCHLLTVEYRVLRIQVNHLPRDLLPALSHVCRSISSDV